MIYSAIPPGRSHSVKIFLVGILSCSVLLILILALLIYSVKISSNIDSLSDLNEKLNSKFLELTESQSGHNDEELLELLEMYGGVVNKLHNPLFYLSEIEKYKSDQVAFVLLTYEVNSKTIKAVIKTKNDHDVSQFLSSLESSEVFETVELIKKDRRRDGTFRYSFNVSFL